MNAYTRMRDADAGAVRLDPNEEYAREGFRPLALPALAAAVQANAAAERAAHAKRTARLLARIVHEDEPLP